MSDSTKPSANPSPSQPIIIRENIDSLSQSLSDQVEMLAGELRARWRSGKRVGIESLGSAFEQVAKNEEQLLDLIYHEVLVREEFGEKPSLDDFTSRFPQHVERLKRLFAVHGAIEDDGWEDELDSAFADDAGTLMSENSAERGDPSSTELGDSGLRKKAHWPRKSRDTRPVDPPPGYELLEELGRGGMAVVFRAKQQILNRIVALKMLLAGGVASKEVLARVQQEAQAVAQLQHPGIVQIHEVGEHRGLPFLSLEYVAGGTLYQWLDGRPLPPLEAARVIEQLARTTQYAHERGVVHRDLKPANVLLSGEWGVRSGEWGVRSGEWGVGSGEKGNDSSELSRTPRLAEGDGLGSRLLRGDERIPNVGTLRNDKPDSSGRDVDPSKHRGGTGTTTHEGVPQLPQHRERFIEGTGNTSDSQPASGIVARTEASGTAPTDRRDQSDAGRVENVVGKQVRSGEWGVGSKTQTSPRVPLPTPHCQLPTVKISDFGLARVLGSRSDLTATGQVIGTPSYMAPEQAAGTCDDVSPAQDIYSLGAILYELLTGRPPFRGATLFDTLEQVRTTEAVPPRQLQPRVPRDLETICLKCLEKSPERRYPTALALAEDLRRAQDGDTITARPAGSFERTWKLVRRYPAIASLASLTVLMTVIGVVGVMREARRATESERLAQNDKRRANELRVIADRERDDAKKQRQQADKSRLKAEQQTEIALRERLNAENQKNLAEASQKRAEQQQQVAEEERARAVQAQIQAEASLEQTFKTINTFATFAFSLRFEPGMQSVSKRLLDNTLQLYDELVKKQGDTSASRRQRITALIAAGDVHRTMRQDQQAEKLLIQAADLLNAELQSNPSEYSLHAQATGIYWALGVLYKDTNRPKESLEAFRQDLASHDVLLEQRPNDSDRRVSKANLFINMCVAYKALGQPLDALTTYEAAILTLREILKQFPNHASALNELGLALHDYSTLLRSLARKAESDEAHREAFEIRKRLFQLGPQYSGYRTFLSRSYVSQGYYDRADGKHDSSIENFRQAVELLQPLVDRSPDIYEHQIDLINAMTEELASCMLADNTQAGRPLFDELSKQLGNAAQRFSKDKATLGLVATWQYRFADLLWEEGQKTKAQLVANHALAASLAVMTTTPKLTDAEEARYSNNAAWRLTVAFEPALRDLKKAVVLARRAVELAPDNANNWHTLGTALYYSGNYPEAREALLKSISFEQPAAKRSTLEELAQAFKALPKGDIAASRKDFEASLGLNKSSPDAMALHYSMLAMTFWKLDDKDAARQILSLVVDPPKGFTAAGPESRRLIAEARTLIAD